MVSCTLVLVIKENNKYTYNILGVYVPWKNTLRIGNNGTVLLYLEGTKKNSLIW